MTRYCVQPPTAIAVNMQPCSLFPRIRPYSTTQFRTRSCQGPATTIPPSFPMDSSRSGPSPSLRCLSKCPAQGATHTARTCLCSVRVYLPARSHRSARHLLLSQHRVLTVDDVCCSSILAWICTRTFVTDIGRASNARKHNAMHNARAKKCCGSTLYVFTVCRTRTRTQL